MWPKRISHCGMKHCVKGVGKCWYTIYMHTSYASSDTANITLAQRRRAEIAAEHVMFCLHLPLIVTIVHINGTGKVYASKVNASVILKNTKQKTLSPHNIGKISIPWLKRIDLLFHEIWYDSRTSTHKFRILSYLMDKYILFGVISTRQIKRVFTATLNEQYEHNSQAFKGECGID